MSLNFKRFVQPLKTVVFQLINSPMFAINSERKPSHIRLKFGNLGNIHVVFVNVHITRSPHVNIFELVNVILE